MEPKTPDWDRTKDILHTLLELPPEARGRQLRQACGDDIRLRADVESLLTAHENAGHFAERSALQVLADADDAHDAAESSPPFLQPGDRLGPYEIQACLGTGGMGEVYKAVDTRLQRLVAVKVLRSHAAGPQHRERFEREARVIARLLHPNICVLHDIGNEGGLAYLVMEHLDGETLAERLGRGPLPAEEAIRYAIDIADALAETHRNGIAHRDIKPTNIMLTSSGAKLLDFGVAKQLVMAARATDGATAAERPSKPWSSVFGTPLYMAPEQLRGDEVDHRTDIFALGAVLYEMVTARKAFRGDGSLIDGFAARENQPPAMAVEGSPLLQKIDAVVQRCLATNPEDRWQSASEVRQALAGATEEPRAWRVPLAATAIVMAALVVIAWPNGSDDSDLGGWESVTATRRAGVGAPTTATNDIELPPGVRTRAIARGGADDSALRTRSEAKAARPEDPEIDKAAPDDDGAVIRRVVETYIRAIETKNIALFQSVKPDLTTEERTVLDTAFKQPLQQFVSFRILSIVRTKEAASVRLGRRDFLDMDGRQDVIEDEQVLTLTRTGNGFWFIAKIAGTGRWTSK